MYEHLVSDQSVIEAQLEHLVKQNLMADRREAHFDFCEGFSSFCVVGMAPKRKMVLERVLEEARARSKQVLLCHQWTLIVALEMMELKLLIGQSVQGKRLAVLFRS
jgi:hypothetical protein